MKGNQPGLLLLEERRLKDLVEERAEIIWAPHRVELWEVQGDWGTRRNRGRTRTRMVRGRMSKRSPKKRWRGGEKRAKEVKDVSR